VTTMQLTTCVVLQPFANKKGSTTNLFIFKKLNQLFYK